MALGTTVGRDENDKKAGKCIEEPKSSKFHAVAKWLLSGPYVSHVPNANARR